MGWIRVVGLMGVVLTGLAAPAAAKTVLDTVGEAGPFTVLLAAVKQAGLAEVLDGPGPYTLFAPSDDAFGKLPKPVYELLFKPENKQKLKDLILHHVISGAVHGRDVTGKRLEATPMFGEPLLIDATRNIMVDDAKVTLPDMKADNGVVHVVDTVLMLK